MNGSYSRFVGTHTFKMGADYRRIGVSSLTLGCVSGCFQFDKEFTSSTGLNNSSTTEGSSFASFLLGYPTGDSARQTEHVQNLKRGLHDRAPKTVNNVLTVLNVLLKKAVEWNVVDRVPCVIRLLPIPKPSAGFYDFDEYERLILAAKALDRATLLIVLLGGDAGLRCGEIMALEWRDIDLHRRQLWCSGPTGKAT